MTGMDEINRVLRGLPPQPADDDQTTATPEPMTAREWFDRVLGRPVPGEDPAPDEVER